MDNLYLTIGKLHYSHDCYKLIVEIDQGISDLYRSLIPKYLPVLKPKYAAHITVVRAEKEIPVNLEFWGKYEAELVEVFYSPEIKTGKIYYWLNCFCKRLDEIRIELGLPASSEYTRPPEGFLKCYHCTIANQKL